MAMLLAVDVGNSRTALGVFSEKKLIATWNIATNISRTGDELWSLLSPLFEEIELSVRQLTKIVIASVVPKASDIFLEFARIYLKQEPLFISHDIVHKMKIFYDPPSSVGADRLCGAVAAFRRVGGPLIVLDFGTATVLDVINSNGDYLGGLIAPGLQSSMEALHRTTSLLPYAELSYPKTVIGNNTVNAIQSGILYGTVEMISGLIAKIKLTEKGNWKIVATGGFADILSQHCKDIQFVIPELVLEGIRLIAEEQ
jgi:type III pantothenate kinase